MLVDLIGAKLKAAISWKIATPGADEDDVEVVDIKGHECRLDGFEEHDIRFSLLHEEKGEFPFLLGERQAFTVFPDMGNLIRNIKESAQKYEAQESSLNLVGEYPHAGGY